MLVLITYDVSTETKSGKTRLRKVAKVCTDYGQRVQNSVFECLLTPAQLKLVQFKLSEIMNESEDSIRFYNLGSSYHNRIEHYGVKVSYNAEGVLIV